MVTVGQVRTGVLRPKYGLTAYRILALMTGVVVLSFPGTASASFGVEKFESSLTMSREGSPATQAGSHPYSLVTALVFNHRKPTPAEVEVGFSGEVPEGNPKDLEVNLPPGLIVNPAATATRCTEAQLENTGECPNSSAVGILVFHLALFGAEGTDPVFNMVPPPGVPAELGFNVTGFGIIVHILGKVRTGGDYGLSATVSNISQKAGLYGSTLTLWGSPSDKSHDKERGYCGSTEGQERQVAREEREIRENGGEQPERTYFCAVTREYTPLLTLPGLCTGEPLISSITVDSWQEPGSAARGTTTSPPVTGCGKLDFSPAITVKPGPGAVAADSPSGLSFDLKVPQDESVSGLAEANLKDAVVTLPLGMAVSPSAANGLGACTPSEIALNDASVPTCPDSAKVGSAEVVTPLLDHPLKGSVYLAQQGNNPFGALLALYLVVEGSGALIKLAGHVEADPLTGQLTTTFTNNPQLPFSDLTLQFFGGPRAPLVTPPACGSYETRASLTPWSGAPATAPSDSFAISSGSGGGPCPAGQFAPSFTAGTTNNDAGGFSPFATTFSRHDGEQRLGAVQVHLPPGLLGVLKSVVQCPEPQASLGTCGPESQIGHTTTGAGPGTDPFYVGGNVFLTGPYKGAPFGLSIVVHALAGPFDLGNVIVRAAVSIDPHTAQVTVASDSLPRILQGIPLDLRTVNVTVDRPGFLFNPTNCAPLSVTGTIASTNGASAGVSSAFEAANCANLPFKPSFTVSTQGKTSKVNGASLVVKVAQNPGEANIHKVNLQLPLALPSRLTTLQKACIASQFESNPAGCPEGSFVGTATAHTPLLAVPLTGPAILVSHGGAAFPDVVFVLQGEGIRIDLVGNTDIKKGITFSRFETVPDAPISSFETNLPEGPHSALATYRNLCALTKIVTVTKRVGHVLGKVKQTVADPLLMPTTITGQNGAVVQQTTKIAVTGCPNATKAKKAKNAKKASKARYPNRKGRK